MARWIYSASGIEVSCPDGIELPSGWFVPADAAGEAAEEAAAEIETAEEPEAEAEEPEAESEEDELSSAEW